MSWQNTFARPGSLADAAELYLGPATVLALQPDGLSARVQIGGEGEARTFRAEVALGDPASVGPGARVLVVTAGEGAAYVIGVLGARADRSVATAGGSSAAVVHVGGAERVEVRNERQELLFEYDEAAHRARLHVPSGDLDVLVPEGDLTLASNQAVRLRGRTVDVQATSSIRLAVHDLAARLLSTLGITPGGVGLRTGQVRIEAARGDVRLKEARLTGERLEAEASSIRSRAERIETEAETVVERAGQVLQDVKGLIQTRAGRVRALIAGTWLQRAKRADLRSEDVFKVDGDRIHLG